MNKRVYLFALAITMFAGCQKLLNLEPPVNTVVFQTAFTDDLTATATVNGLYARIMGSPQYFSSFGLSLYPALMADELYNVNPSASYDPFTAAKLQPSLTAVNGVWGAGYQYIYHINNCLEGLQSAIKLTDSVRSGLLGEMKFMRAFCYANLVNLFGELPLVRATSYVQNASLPRSPLPMVMNQVFTDLEEAMALLPATYITGGKARPNKYAAMALMARCYLYGGNWQKASESASAIINAGVYSLPALASVFLNNSTETIWQLNTTGLTYNTFEGSAFIPSSASVVPVFAVSTSLITAFETADNRKTAWLGKNTIAATVYYYPNKYKVRTGSTITENPVYFRLAEQYLIRAEAWARQDNLVAAKLDLNTIRARAGLPPVTTGSKEDLLAAIQHERQVELFTEWGHRWLDLKRTGKLDFTLAPVKPAWQSTAAWWPLPAAQLELNPALTQNPGY